MTLVPASVPPRLSTDARAVPSGVESAPATALMEPRVSPKELATSLVVPPMRMVSLESRVESALSVLISAAEKVRDLVRALVNSALDRWEVPRVVVMARPSEVAARPVLVRTALDRVSALRKLASELRMAPSADTIAPRLLTALRRVPLAIRLRLLFVLEMVEVMAAVIAAMKVEPTRLLTAAVLALATPGVTVPPPLPMQHPTPGRPEALAIDLIKSVSKLPGSMTVVQHLLALMLRMVRLLPLMKC